MCLGGDVGHLGGKLAVAWTSRMRVSTCGDARPGNRDLQLFRQHVVARTFDANVGGTMSININNVDRCLCGVFTESPAWAMKPQLKHWDLFFAPPTADDRLFIDCIFLLLSWFIKRRLSLYCSVIKLSISRHTRFIINASALIPTLPVASCRFQNGFH